MSEIVRLGHGLVRSPASVQTVGDRCAAWLSVLPADTALGGITAARLHGLWLPEARVDETPEFTLIRPGRHPRECAGSRRTGIRARRRLISPEDVMRVDGLPVTALARTWIDVAEVLAIEDLIACGDSVLRSGVATAELEEAVRRAAGRRGVRRARQALALLDGRSRSRPESHLRCALVLGGLPRPEVNRAIYTAYGEWLAEPDLLYRRARLALEYNGAGHAAVEQMRKDITRELNMDEHAWKVVVFGPAEVFGRPWRIVPYVTSLLDERDPGWRNRRSA